MKLNLFSFCFKKEVEKTEDSIYQYLRHGKVEYKVNKHDGSQFFTDQQSEWVYVQGVYMVNFQKIEEGNTYQYSDGVFLIRTETAQEVEERAKKYFCPFIQVETVNSKETQPKKSKSFQISLKEEDKTIFLN